MSLKVVGNGAAEPVLMRTAKQVREEVDRLMGLAKGAAVSIMEGKPATDETLAMLSKAVYTAVLLQVKAGMWAQLAVVEVGQMSGLRIMAEYGNRLLGEPPVVIRYDFSKTALPSIVPNKKAWL